MSEGVNIDQREGVKLIKNTKGYNWEVKLFILPDETPEKFIERLTNYNNALKNNFKEE